ncbi:MAG: type II toxin-antitoxin system HicA family toxin [Thermaceae bacterium]|nr:type II toxin-antitoxin system HicA family toxin [Thermaceae bacterium]
MEKLSQRELIRRLQVLGFEGPFPGKRHQRMVRGNVRVPIPNPHEGDIGPNLLVVILRQAGVGREEWEGAGE